MITETSHVGEQRGEWLLEVARQGEFLLQEGVPLTGVCLYPILGMPEWHAPETWTPLGLWDPISHREPHKGRVICEPMLQALRAARFLNERFRLGRAASASAQHESRRNRVRCSIG